MNTWKELVIDSQKRKQLLCHMQVYAIPRQKILSKKYFQLVWDGVLQQSRDPLPVTWYRKALNFHYIVGSVFCNSGILTSPFLIALTVTGL